MERARAWVLEFLGQIRVWLCRHDGNNVTADLTEGDIGDHGIGWCRSCGSVRRRRGEWATPLDPWRSSLFPWRRLRIGDVIAQEVRRGIQERSLVDRSEDMKS